MKTNKIEKRERWVILWILKKYMYGRWNSDFSGEGGITENDSSSRFAFRIYVERQTCQISAMCDAIYIYILKEQVYEFILP